MTKSMFSADERVWTQVGVLEHPESGWVAAYASLAGTDHEDNEDAVGVRSYKSANSEECLNVAAADGVGSGALPAQAAAATVDQMLAIEPQQEGDIVKAVYVSDDYVARVLARFTSRPGASMVACAFLLPDGSGWYTRVGDARIWHLKSGSAINTSAMCTALTQDQTYAFTGEVPPPGGRMTDPANMIGTGCVGKVEVWSMPNLTQGDYLLLGTDGLSKGLNDGAIAEIFRTSPFEEMPQRLCERARANGSRDDISVVLVRRIKRHSAACDANRKQDVPCLTRIVTRLRKMSGKLTWFFSR